MGSNADGGGIYTRYGSGSLTSSTVSGNASGGAGGGVFVYDSGTNPVLTFENSIVADNTASGTGPDLMPDPDSPFAVNYSLIGDTSGSGITGTTGTGNILNQPALLGPLAGNGGPTLTHAVSCRAAQRSTRATRAIAFSPTEFDQQGAPFATRDWPSNRHRCLRVPVRSWSTPSRRCERRRNYIDRATSHYERRSNRPTSLYGADTITFDPMVFGTQQTIALASQLPTITADLTITGPGQTLLTLDAGNGTDNLPGTGDGFRIFNINDGTGDLIDVTLTGLTLSGGDYSVISPGNGGGAIFSRENLTIVSSTISGNSAVRGGGIFNYSATANITSSTISGNSSSSLGGGIYNRYGIANIISSTISGNLASGGGGIFNTFATANFTNSTFSGNSASANGGGILNQYGEANLVNSSVSGNSAGGSGGGIYNKTGTFNAHQQHTQRKFGHRRRRLLQPLFRYGYAEQYDCRQLDRRRRHCQSVWHRDWVKQLD